MKGDLFTIYNFFNKYLSICILLIIFSSFCLYSSKTISINNVLENEDEIFFPNNNTSNFFWPVPRL